MNSLCPPKPEQVLRIGDVLGRRFEVVAHDPHDSGWPILARDVAAQDGAPHVRLAIANPEARFHDEGRTDSWEGSWPDPPEASVQPVLSVHGLVHGGGRLDAWAVRDSAAALPNPSDAAAPSQRLDGLRRLYAGARDLEGLPNTATIGLIDCRVFRLATSGPGGALRPQPGPHTHRPRSWRRATLRVLRRIAWAYLDADGGRVVEGKTMPRRFFFETRDPWIRRPLRRVLRGRDGDDRPLTWATWLGALGQLIAAIDWMLLDEASRESRRACVSYLVDGRFDAALKSQRGSHNAWASALVSGLRQRRAVTLKQFHAWCQRAADASRPLEQQAAELRRLRATGFALPTHHRAAAFEQDASLTARHLRDAAQTARTGCWKQAAAALGAAIQLNPASEPCRRWRDLFLRLAAIEEGHHV